MMENFSECTGWMEKQTKSKSLIGYNPVYNLKHKYSQSSLYKKIITWQNSLFDLPLIDKMLHLAFC